MALQTTQTLKSGITITDGYLKVTSVSGNKNRVMYRAELAIDKANADSKNFITGFMATGMFVPEENNFNFITQSYEDLKSKITNCTDI